MATSTVGHLWSRLRRRVPIEAIGLLLGGAVAMLAGVYLHELTHLAVYAQYGCSGSIQWLPSSTQHVAVAVARPDPGCWQSLTAAQRRELTAAQLLVEALGYQLVPVYGILGAMIGFVVASVARR